MQSDKQAIVLEIGARFVKCGLSEERAPRSVQRWELAELLRSHPTVAQCREYLSPQLRRLLFDVLHVNPRHRRFLVCEDVTAPRALRVALMDVLFTHLKAASATVVPSMLMAQFATSFHTALVVDCGWGETRVLPVFKGIPLLYMLTICLDQDPIMDAADACLHAAGQVNLTIPGHLRGDVTEHLFRETHEGSIVSTVAQVIRKLPLDVRAAMTQNLLVIGGTAMLPGFCARLVEELKVTLAAEELSPGKQQQQSPVALVPLYFPRNMASWVGASVYGATDAARRHLISANEYLSTGSGCLPDWMSVAETEDESVRVK
ncbi:hypothetical protein P43SY_003785 [Pythium insidiosum]|uniref:Actin-related protein 10 n=1 Tax=Pythium insidiosum TaxID=114742 RepID=A0AAD5M446_PYTIN|nr:hypothetical protein P43SY_003785 [Pythium insidiosum]